MFTLTPHQKKIFSQSFDAREFIQAKEIMDTYTVTNLTTRDLVCIELQIMRWKPDKSGDNQFKWVEWKMKLELKAIYLLAKSKQSPVQSKADIDFVV